MKARASLTVALALAGLGLVAEHERHRGLEDGAAFASPIALERAPMLIGKFMHELQQWELKTAAVMCGQEGRNAARASCTQRRHKNTRRRSSDRQRTGLAATGRLRTG